MQSTIALFKQLTDTIPPLFPEDLKYQIKKDLKNVQESEMDLGSLEDMMVQYGYEVWPWNQAFKEILTSTEEKVGEQFLLANLPNGLQEKYLEYRQLGLSLRDFYSGKLANYLDEDQRMLLSVALVNMQTSIRDFATREAVGLKKEFYLNKVQEFKVILEEIKCHLNNLKDLADKEENHTTLAGEIRARVEAFEHGMCLLAPELLHEEVKMAQEFFAGRKQELNRLRGINKTVEIDFYNQAE
ncbi:MAG: hypothetical protein WCT11_04660 [Candidatus Magasanikbacteria bacterium]